MVTSSGSEATSVCLIVLITDDDVVFMPPACYHSTYCLAYRYSPCAFTSPYYYSPSSAA
jgi:hypothetical protein